MSTAAKVGVVVVALACAYPAASWFSGKQTQSIVDEQYQLISNDPMFRIVSRNYERGVFKSNESVVFAFGDEDMELFRVKVNTVIMHGPLPGFSTLAAATADSQVTMEWDDLEEDSPLQLFFNSQKPVTAHTVWHFDGSGKMNLQMPAFDSTSPDYTIAFRGFNADMTFTPKMSTYVMKGGGAGLDVEAEQGTLRVSGVSFDGDVRRLFEDRTLYAGKQHLLIDKIAFEPLVTDLDAQPVTLENIRYEMDSPVNGELIDYKLMFSAEVIKVADVMNFGPAHLDMSYKNLHARTVADFYDMLAGSSRPDGLNPDQMAGMINDTVMKLLSYNPEMTLDRLSFNAPGGEAMMTGYVRLPDVQEGDLAMPLMLIGKVDAGADISVPARLLEQTGVAETLIEQGAVKPGENNQMISQVRFKDGDLTVNGQPYNPAMLFPQRSGMMDDDDDDFDMDDSDSMFDEE